MNRINKKLHICSQLTVESQRAFGLLFLRLILGLIFFMQGYGKVMKFGVQNVYEQFFKTYTELLPEFLVVSTAYYTSYVELIGGALLMIGLFRFYNYLALALVLIVVSFGHGLMDPIWDLHHVFFRVAILATLFFMPVKWDKFSLDQLIFHVNKQ